MLLDDVKDFIECIEDDQGEEVMVYRAEYILSYSGKLKDITSLKESRQALQIFQRKLKKQREYEKNEPLSQVALSSAMQGFIVGSAASAYHYGPDLATLGWGFLVAVTASVYKCIKRIDKISSDEEDKAFYYIDAILRGIEDRIARLTYNQQLTAKVNASKPVDHPLFTEHCLVRSHSFP